MIQIAVVTRQGVAPGQHLAAQFGPAGGTIGRAETNTLVLQDPDRTVSRVHAQVLCREGRYFVVDRGSNPMHCNGHALGAGREAPLADGDRLVIGSFELSVHAVTIGAKPHPHGAGAGPGPDDDPFADLLSGLPAPAPGPAARPAAAGRAPPSGASAADPFAFANPMESGSRNAGAAAVDPFADLLGSGAASAVGAGALDDFSDLTPPPAGKAAGIDDLFGGPAGGGGPGGDPLALSPLADPLLQPNTAGADDPFAALQGGAPVAPRPRSDHLPIDQFGYTPPRAMPPPAPPAPVAVRAPVALPVSSAPSSPDALLAALLRGLGSTHQMPQTLTPELMERIGVLLRTATEGALQLLLARREFKNVVRADVTRIASEANNPLKFSPSAEVALAHLLGPGMRGFMPAEAAMHDTFDDLRAHQFGVMVGLRAALAHVIERFEPGELEKKIAAKSALDSLFAANRKAKLWDQFVALYAGIASEAEDDFHTLFGKAFLEAYEAQMARLKSGR